MRSVRDTLSRILTYLEFLLYKQKKHKKRSISNLENLGWEKIDVNLSKLFPIKCQSTLYHSPYSDIIILSKQEIDSLINKIFIKNNILYEIKDRLGMNYCIDFFLHWEIRSIPEIKKNDQYFANLWHTDSLFSNNVIKLFILTHDTDSDDGPITWIDRKETIKKKYSYKLIKNNIDLDSISKSFTGKQGDLCMINPNQCMHKAGIPKANRKRRLMMFQLNPSRKLSYRQDLYQKQFKLEPNLPLIKNIFRKKVYI